MHLETLLFLTTNHVTNHETFLCLTIAKTLQRILRDGQNFQGGWSLFKPGCRPCGRACILRNVPPLAHCLPCNGVIAGCHVLVVVLVIDPEERDIECAALRVKEELLLEVPGSEGPFTEPGV